jgi:uncharacterized protein YndB with AHSA1/START domain
MSDRPAYVYVTYIESTPEKVWQALTDPELTGEYWGHHNVSDWQVGSKWEHVRTDGSGIADIVGEVLVSDPPRRLVTTWPPSQVAFDIEPYQDIVRLTVTHENLPDAELADAASGWSAVLSNLKTRLETGHPLPQAPWGMDDPSRR